MSYLYPTITEVLDSITLKSHKSAQMIWKVRISMLEGIHIKELLFPVPARLTFRERIEKKLMFYFIKFDVFGATIIVFR